jgi:hypothetical protein
MTIANLLEHADAAINFYAAVIVVVAMAVILAVWLFRERRRSADLRSRVVTLESRVDAVDSLLVGLLKTLMKSQSPSEQSGHATEDLMGHFQELEYELQAMRNQKPAPEDITTSKGETARIATSEAGASADEYKIGNLLRRLATL